MQESFVFYYAPNLQEKIAYMKIQMYSVKTLRLPFVIFLVDLNIVGVVRSNWDNQIKHQENKYNIFL